MARTRQCVCDSEGDVLELTLGCISSTLGLAPEHPRYVMSAKTHSSAPSRSQTANISCLGVSSRDQSRMLEFWDQHMFSVHSKKGVN